MRYDKTLGLLVAAICFCPVVAGAQPPDPTASDAHGNTAAGTDALLNVTASGYYNTAVGFWALKATTDALYNTAIGGFALPNNTTGNYNTASGYHALSDNTTGDGNTANGYYALSDNTTGNNNTASGESALQSNTTGAYNTAAGHTALFANTTGSENTAAGHSALRANTTGNYNVANGVTALYANTTGNYNVASGGSALGNNTTGANNTAVGYRALQTTSTGNNNVALGYHALFALAAGGNNIALGANAGSKTTKGARNIYIGSPGLAATESDTIRIGSAQTRTFVAGIADSPMAGATVVIKSNGRLGVVASSARYKQDIAPLDDAADKLAQLRPVSYRYKAEPEATHYGLIAEEVDAVMPELVVRDGQNRPESVQYLELIPLLLQQWKAQQAEIAREHAENVQQRALIERQQSELAALRRALAVRLAALDGGKRE
jgi:hypothetical protein